MDELRRLSESTPALGGLLQCIVREAELLADAERRNAALGAVADSLRERAVASANRLGSIAADRENAPALSFQFKTTTRKTVESQKRAGTPPRYCPAQIGDHQEISVCHCGPEETAE